MDHPFAAGPPEDELPSPELETRTLRALVHLAACVDDALDNSEEVEGGSIIAGPWWVVLCAALDGLKELPDDRPGYTMGPAAKAQWALRRISKA